MGGGSWTTKTFDDYTKSTRGVSLREFETQSLHNAQDVYGSTKLSPVLDPKNVMRECRDSEEHPNTLPVILALDVTGSMGHASVLVAQRLNQIMTDIYNSDSVKDVEFCIMGIGDAYYDKTPIQISQFESDIRIAEQLDEIYFEGCGGGNGYESYTAAWYMGVYHCDLDCWKRGEKGIIITMGDELPNPYLPKNGRNCGLAAATGDKLQDNIDTVDLLPKTLEKYDVYHISVDSPHSSYRWNQRVDNLDKHWKDLIGEDHYSVVTIYELAGKISEIITNKKTTNNVEEITW